MIKTYVLAWEWSSPMDSRATLELTFFVPEKDSLRALRGMRDGLQAAGFNGVTLGEKTEGVKEIT